MNFLIVSPILIPLITAICCLFAGRYLLWQRVIGILGALALMTVSLLLLRHVRHDGIVAAQMGNWTAPFGITLVADLFSAIMVVLTGIVAVAVAFYSMFSLDRARESFGY